MRSAIGVHATAGAASVLLGLQLLPLGCAAVLSSSACLHQAQVDCLCTMVWGLGGVTEDAVSHYS